MAHGAPSDGEKTAQGTCQIRVSVRRDNGDIATATRCVRGLPGRHAPHAPPWHSAARASSRVLVSKDFIHVDNIRDRLVSVGRYALRGVAHAQELFTLDPDA
jgi:hypothetical protein